MTELRRLLQSDIIDDALPAMGERQWQDLYFNEKVGKGHFTVWCALLTRKAATKARQRTDWDLQIGSGGPGFVTFGGRGPTRSKYYRFGDDDGVRPLVYKRSFEGAAESYVEIDEEFRHYHNLAEDRERGALVAFDSSGRPLDVVRIQPKRVQIQMRWVRQFLAGTQLVLALYVDSVRFCPLSLDHVPLELRHERSTNASLLWQRDVARDDFGEGLSTFSRLLAKKLIAPQPRRFAGIPPFDRKEDKPVTFVIGVSPDGEQVEAACDPEGLDNNFGSAPGAPHYLTPVFFRREVLSKYYAESNRYHVEDGLLRCLHLWCVRIDNDSPDYVIVYLGDLGRDIPYEERLHWRQYNVSPDGPMSRTNFKRSIEGEFADPTSPDLVFRSKYSAIRKSWRAVYGWDLFLEPDPGDRHLARTIRVPTTASQAEFDEQVGNLAKLLVDALNEAELQKRASTLEAGAKGLRKLEAFLEAVGCAERAAVLHCLRAIQALRSAGSAHRKGSGYQATMAKHGLPERDTQKAARLLLLQANDALEHLEGHLLQSAKAG